MNRYNIFNQIHKGLRAWLYDTALKLQQTNFADPDQAVPVLDQMLLLLEAFEKHAHHEDNTLMPYLISYDASIVAAFESEHGEDHALAMKLRGLAGAYQHAVSTDGKLETGHIISLSFVEFMIFNLEHMAREEKLLNALLWKFYTDEEIMAINRKIVQSIPPHEAQTANGWMIRGLNNAELVNWFRAVEKSAPLPVFNGLLEMAEDLLPASRFSRLTGGLMEGALLVS